MRADSSVTRTPLVAFVGVLAPTEERRNNLALSQAGATFQESLVEALASAGINVDHVFAQRPTPSFPRVRRLLFGVRRGVLGCRPVTFLPFLNFGVAKAITGGVALVVLLARWGRRNRRVARKAVLLYNLNSPPALASVIAGRLTGTKVIAVVADIQVPGSGSLPNSPFRRLEYRLQTFTMSLCDGLVVLTNRMAADFAPMVPSMLVEGAVPPQLVSSYTTVDDHNGVPNSDGKGDPTILMFAGEISDLKGVPALLDAFSRIPNPDIELWITGRGPEQARVVAAAAADARIRYWGYPPYSELLALYQQATLLVNPHSVGQLSSRYLFPSKLIEYLATGVPVLSTPSTPEIAELYGAFAFITADDSADALARSIMRTLSYPRSELRSRGAAGREFVLREKTWEVQGRHVAAFIEAVLSDSSDD